MSKTMDTLTSLSQECSSDQMEAMIKCIITAPNSYKLFLLSIDVRHGQDPKINQQAVNAAQMIINSVSNLARERAIQKLATQMTVVQQHPIDGLLNQIKIDPSKLIEKSLKYNISQSVHAILYSMSLIFEGSFASEIIAHYLNLPEHRFWSLLKPLFKELVRRFGDETTLVSQTLSIDTTRRTSLFWKNLVLLLTRVPNIILDLNLISQLLVDKLCATQLDIYATAQIIKVCCHSLERVEHGRICIGTKHRLCMSLATCFFSLIEVEGENFPEILSYLRVTLTCMSLLKQSSVASHILCRALLERSLVYGHLFNKDFQPDQNGSVNHNDWNQIKLSSENLKVTLGHRFRRLPKQIVRNTDKSRELAQSNDSNNGIPDRQSINSYLLTEAFKSSIDSIEEFANLFVEFLCPVMFDKESWPSDEALRVINERNLSILRKFEQVPPLWDLYELIGQSKRLKNCLVLVKALLAAHIALWASATTKSCPDKMSSTIRLIPPLAQSDLVPKAFGLTVEVLPHLSSNEIFSVLTDIWQYLKDTNNFNPNDEASVTLEEKRYKAKIYLNRLRLFMCQHVPGPLYVKIFKEFYAPMPKMIPT